MEQALSGRVRDHHRFLIAAHLNHIDFLDEQIAVFDTQIAAHIAAQTSFAEPLIARTSDSDASPLTPPTTASAPLAWEQAVVLLDTILGVGRQTAELLLAEVGTDMSRFPSAAHLARWARVCPGNYESAGKRYAGLIGQANNWLGTARVQAANAAARSTNSYLSAV